MSQPDLPPPPPIPGQKTFPTSGVGPSADGAPSVAQAAAPASKPAPTPEEFDKMLGFVNEVRRHRGLECLAALPKATGSLASGRPLSKALGCSVIKHKDNGPFYGLVYKKEIMDALVQVGVGAMTSTPRVMSEPDSTMWEVRLPTFLKPFA